MEWLYTSTAFWQRLTTIQPLHPTRRRGLLRQSALRKAVQTTAAQRNTTKHHKIRQNPQQSLGNASWKVCLWKHSLKAWISWIKLRPFSHEIKIFKATLCQNPQLKTATPLFQGPSRFAGSNQKANFKHHMHEVHQHASAIINVHQKSTTCILRSVCTQPLLAERASALVRALPGHWIPPGVEVSFGKGLSAQLYKPQKPKTHTNSQTQQDKMPKKPSQCTQWLSKRWPVTNPLL